MRGIFIKHNQIPVLGTAILPVFWCETDDFPVDGTLTRVPGTRTWLRWTRVLVSPRFFPAAGTSWIGRPNPSQHHTADWRVCHIFFFPLLLRSLLHLTSFLRSQLFPLSYQLQYNQITKQPTPYEHSDTVKINFNIGFIRRQKKINRPARQKDIIKISVSDVWHLIVGQKNYFASHRPFITILFLWLISIFFFFFL